LFQINTFFSGDSPKSNITVVIKILHALPIIRAFTCALNIRCVWLSIFKRKSKY